MQQYKELHHQLGVGEDGKRAWLGPREVGQRSLDEKTAADLNAQFENSGIKYEIVEAKQEAAAGDDNAADMIDHEVTQECLDANPELAENGINVGDTVKIKPTDPPTE